MQRADRPTDHYELTPDDPRNSLNYYYQIRSNITHRGKGVVRDHDIVRASLKELLEIFTELVRAAFESSSKGAPNQSLEPAPGRCEVTFDFMKQFHLFSTLAAASGGSALSR